MVCGGDGIVSITVSIVAIWPPSGLIWATSTAPPLLGSGPASLRPARSSTTARLPTVAPIRDPLGVADSHPYAGPPLAPSRVSGACHEPSAATPQRFGKQR